MASESGERVPEPDEVAGESGQAASEPDEVREQSAGESTRGDETAKQVSDVDLDKLLAELEVEAETTRELADRLGEESKTLEGSSERLIDDMAENLATLREAAGLPPKGVEDLKQKIKRRQRSQQRP